MNKHSLPPTTRDGERGRGLLFRDGGDFPAHLSFLGVGGREARTQGERRATFSVLCRESRKKNGSTQQVPFLLRIPSSSRGFCLLKSLLGGCRNHGILGPKGNRVEKGKRAVIFLLLLRLHPTPNCREGPVALSRGLN